MQRKDGGTATSRGRRAGGQRERTTFREVRLVDVVGRIGVVHVEGARKVAQARKRAIAGPRGSEGSSHVARPQLPSAARLCEARGQRVDEGVSVVHVEALRARESRTHADTSAWTSAIRERQCGPPSPVDERVYALLSAPAEHSKACAATQECDTEHGPHQRIIGCNIKPAATAYRAHSREGCGGGGGLTCESPMTTTSRRLYCVASKQLNWKRASGSGRR
jgi:hypothetical protein